MKQVISTRYLLIAFVLLCFIVSNTSLAQGSKQKSALKSAKTSAKVQSRAAKRQVSNKTASKKANAAATRGKTKVPQMSRNNVSGNKTRPPARTPSSASANNSATTPPSAEFRAPSGMGGEKALQVRGQTRNLNMMLVVKNEKDRINFVELRTDYKVEVSNTEY